MAVLTKITDDEARALVAAYGLSDLRAVEGIPAGSVNSNFALHVGAAGSSHGTRLFLRIYEEQDKVGAQHETALLEHLAKAGVPTPAPLRRTDGGLVSLVGEKPVALFPWRDGQMRCQAGVTQEDAMHIGEALARVHLAGAGLAAQEGRFDLEHLMDRLQRITKSGNERFERLVPSLRDALLRTQNARDPAIPTGLIHSDLFRDNVLWDASGRVSALLDFESACRGTYAYDLMVCVLSWCVGDDLEPHLARAMRQGYERVRPLSDAERRGLLAEGSFAALRFTITRITDYALRQRAAGPRVVKDWQRFLFRFERLQALGEEGLLNALSP
ncbi:MAG TPA: homoserine kinase [Polyangiaceae bacterium]|jgi:homoserine kinase type II|nr:homoserine kinase [Polyangiaceae bacterium]